MILIEQAMLRALDRATEAASRDDGKAFAESARVFYAEFKRLAFARGLEDRGPIALLGRLRYELVARGDIDRAAAVEAMLAAIAAARQAQAELN
jgi:hypothetical protein